MPCSVDAGLRQFLVLFLTHLVRMKRIECECKLERILLYTLIMAQTLIVSMGLISTGNIAVAMTARV